MKLNFTKISLLILILTISLLGYVVCKGNQHFNSDFPNHKLSLEQILKNAHIPKYDYHVVNTYPHDKSSFTEGLFLQDDYAYESTGLYGQSKLRKIQLKTGKVLQEYSLPIQFFAEGITALNGKIYMLTYHEQSAFVYDMNTFKLQHTFPYMGEGWGLTTDGDQLIMSNGTSSISFINPKNFKIARSLTVKVNQNKIKSINELEVIDGLIYANVWPTSIIIVFSPKNGQVSGWIDISKLKPESSCLECVANGIAYDEKSQLLIVTGKNWPYLYEIRVNKN